MLASLPIFTNHEGDLYTPTLIADQISTSHVKTLQISGVEALGGTVTVQ